jgi:uncharacterized protein (TIGR00730 family)
MKLCVYLGSNLGSRPLYREAAHAVGASIARRGWTLVYGGSSKGLMGVLSDAALEGDGRVVGVIPQKLLDMGAGRGGLAEFHVVPDMHTRKARMAELSDAFLALPGGVGTWEEALEAATWTQIGYQAKRVAFLNVAGYYDPLVQQFEKAITEGFLSPDFRKAVAFGENRESLLDFLGEGAAPVPVTKWIEP